MVNQYNYRSDNISFGSWGVGDSELKARLKEEKRAQNEAKANRRLQEKTAKANEKKLRKQREAEARAILNERGYTDIKLQRSGNQRPDGCPGGSCQARPMNGSYAARPQEYGYAPIRAQNRSIPVPMNKDGTVKVAYLKQVNNGRSPADRARDYARPASRAYPAKMTPVQAGSWLADPGRSDIQGIDCARNTPVTVYRPKSSANRAPYAVRSMNVVPGAAWQSEQDAYIKAQMGAGTPLRDPRYGYPLNPDGTVQRDFLLARNVERSPVSRRMDGLMVSEKNTLPANPTPYQAHKWIMNKGRYDIIGIDTPETYVDEKGIPINVTISYVGPATEEEARARVKAGSKKGLETIQKNRAKAKKKGGTKNGTKAGPKADNKPGSKDGTKSGKKTPAKKKAGPKQQTGKARNGNGSGRNAANAAGEVSDRPAASTNRKSSCKKSASSSAGRKA